MKQLVGVIMVFFIVVSFSLPCFAQEGEEKNYKEEMQEKISRGLANVLSSFGEIPKGIVDTTKDVEFPVYETVEGLFRGVGKTLVRLISGVYDLVVSPIPNIKTFPPDPERLGTSQ